jgi:hypothetical protein
MDMRTRSHWLAGGVAALLALALIGSAAASQFVLGLDTDDTQWPIGTEANLDVTVDAALLGGYGTLLRKIGDDDPEVVKTFDFSSTSFTITAPIPNDPEIAGEWCSFRFRAYTEGGVSVGVSNKKRRPIPPIDLE